MDADIDLHSPALRGSGRHRLREVGFNDALEPTLKRRAEAGLSPDVSIHYALAGDCRRTRRMAALRKGFTTHDGLRGYGSDQPGRMSAPWRRRWDWADAHAGKTRGTLREYRT